MMMYIIGTSFVKFKPEDTSDQVAVFLHIVNTGTLAFKVKELAADVLA